MEPSEVAHFLRLNERARPQKDTQPIHQNLLRNHGQYDQKLLDSDDRF